MSARRLFLPYGSAFDQNGNVLRQSVTSANFCNGVPELAAMRFIRLAVGESSTVIPRLTTLGFPWEMEGLLTNPTIPGRKPLRSLSVLEEFS